MLYPLTFTPLFKERIWGGRALESLYHKALPPAVRIGESWEISDRPNDDSVVANGPLAGKTLHWLVENHRQALLGDTPLHAGRFPLLIKLLDAREKLSLQVHPPAAVAKQLGGEPKTEMWYIADATPEAALYVGLKRGVTRVEFEAKVKTGQVAECFQQTPVRAGDSMFLPSGRVHAIGAGLVIFEIQQNSDTTYRVFDWNRLGDDGKPRALHVAQSLASIDFQDFEPALCRPPWTPQGACQTRSLVEDPLFRVQALRLQKAGSLELNQPGMRILGLTEGQATVTGAGQTLPLSKGQFCLVPASVPEASLKAVAGTAFLLVQPGT